MLNYIRHDGLREDRADGSILLRSKVPLGPVARNTGEWLHEWAQKAPERVFVAERSGQGWREVRYAEMLGQVRAASDRKSRSS
jgi:feruloyl-CoA synthase